MFKIQYRSFCHPSSRYGAPISCRASSRASICFEGTHQRQHTRHVLRAEFGLEPPPSHGGFDCPRSQVEPTLASSMQKLVSRNVKILIGTTPVRCLIRNRMSSQNKLQGDQATRKLKATLQGLWASTSGPFFCILACPLAKELPCQTGSQGLKRATVSPGWDSKEPWSSPGSGKGHAPETDCCRPSGSGTSHQCLA